MIDTESFAQKLRTNAGKISQGKCAKYIRIALAAGGANTLAHPAQAKNYGPLLINNGYKHIASKEPDDFLARKGDIVVFQPVVNGSQAGHVQGFDGKNWISDFVQSGFWPGPVYRKEKPSYALYRP